MADSTCRPLLGSVARWRKPATSTGSRSLALPRVPNFYKLETSEWNLSKYDPLIDVSLDNSNGSLKLNPAPGLGIEINREYLAANAVE
jgi:L-alanine-DL-glutamate epimerase-like enolase superfamily enzyme